MPRPRKAAQPAQPPRADSPSAAAAAASGPSGMELTLSAHPPVSSQQLSLAPPAPPIRAKPNKETTKNVPAFLTKLFTMVSDPATDELIRWSDDGDSFFVPSADRMGKELLPHYFKHQNFGSFVRQLNMYGFHKVPHLQQGVLKREAAEDGDMLEFSNANFQRGQPDLLCMIHRKVKTESAIVPAADGGTLDLSSLINDLAAIRKHQSAISADLKELQARNHALWQEAVQSREKHKKQEETINKILRFLAGVFGGHVLDQGAAAPTPQVQGQATTPDQSQDNGRSSKGGSKGHEVAVMPKSRLLLEDVKGRQSAALRELDGSDDEIEEIPLLRGDDDEDDEMPTISSSLIVSAPTAGMGTLARAPSQSRFTTIHSPSSSSAMPTPSEESGPDASQYGLTPEAFGALVGRTGGDLSPFNALFNHPPPPLLSSSSRVTAAPATPATSLSPSTTSTALMPFVPTSTSNPLENPFSLFASTPAASSAPASATASAAAPILGAATTSAASAAMSPSVASALAQNNSAVATLLSEKADIDSRTSALEAQIARLMENLPDDAREQVENDQPLGEGLLGGAGSASGGGGGGGANGAGGGGSAGQGEGGMDWSKFTMEDGGIDFDKMLAQFSEMANPTSYNFLPSPSAYDASSSAAGFANGVTDYSDILSSSAALDQPNALHAPADSTNDLPLDPALFSSAGAAATGLPYEVTSPAPSSFSPSHAPGSPAGTADSAPTPASTTSEALGLTGAGTGAGAGAAESRRTGSAAATGGGGRKRKSDVLGSAAPSPAASTSAGGAGGASPASEEGTGTRRSQRKRRA